MNRDPAVAGNVDHPAKVQDRVEYSQSLVSGHVDLIQDTEAPLGGAFVYRAGTEYHLPLPEGVGTDHIGGIHVNVKRDIPAGTSENLCQIFCQHIFSCSLCTGQKEIFAAEQSLGRLFPDLFSIVYISGGFICIGFPCSILLPEFQDFLDDPFINVFFP